MAKTHKETTKPIPVWHREEVIDPQTGEVIERYNVKIKERGANFHLMGLFHMTAALDLFGNQKTKILSYILENTNSDNIFLGTQRTIAEKTETSVNTVNSTIQMLVNADIMQKKHSGVYFINPNVIFKGGTNKRMDILYQYHDTSKKKEKKAKV